MARQLSNTVRLAHTSCLGIELVNSCAYWELPNGNAQRTQDLSRTFTPAKFSHCAASNFSSAASSFSSSCQALVVCELFASAPFTSPSLAAAASAKDKAEASAAAAAKA